MDGVIEKRIVIHAKPETVYRTLTESRFLARWLADKADARPVPGGALLLYSGVGDSAKGVEAAYTELVPNRSVRFRWVARISSGERTAEKGVHENAFLIDESPDGVIVTMRDEESPAPSDSERMKTEQGWDQVLVALKTLCEGPEAPGRQTMASGGEEAAMGMTRPPVVTKRKPAAKKARATKGKKAKTSAVAGRRAPKKGTKRSAKKSAKKKARPAARKGAKKASAKKSAKRAPAKRASARKGAKARPRRRK